MVKKKVLDEMESIRDFDHVQKYKQAKTVDRQQPREQKRGLKIKKNCNYCCAAHMQREYLAFGKTCNTCGKQNHFWAVYQGLRR